MMSARLLSVFSLALLMAAVCISAYAVTDEVVILGSDTEKPQVPTGFTPEEAVIGVGSVHFFTIKASAAGYTIPQRARIVNIRLTELLSRRLAGPVTVKPIRGKPTVYVGPVRLVTVYPQDVKAAKAVSARALAEEWAQSLRVGLPTVMPGPVGPRAKPHAGDVCLGGSLLFALRGLDGYPTLDARRIAVDQRVAEALSVRASQVTVAPVDEGVGVFADGRLVVQVIPADAEAAGKTMAALAEEWADRLRAALNRIAAATEPKVAPASAD